MQTVRLRQVGGSVMFAVPKALADQLELLPGSEMAVRVEDGALVAAPSRRKRYRLEDLLIEHEEFLKTAEPDDGWLSDPPVGRELI
jgi:antitoxin ChpS